MILRIRNFVSATLMCLVVFLTLLSGRVGFAQQTTAEDWAFGYEAFNLLLQESDIEICSREEWFRIDDDEKFVVFINFNSDVDWIEVIHQVPALVMSSMGENLNARFRPNLGLVESDSPLNFYSSRDCPIVRPDSEHEVFLGVDSLVCNTPGYISRLFRQTVTVADTQIYPRTKNSRREARSRTFSMIAEDPSKRMWVADPLLFTNQMMFKADGLRFADNTVRWLSDEYRRKNVLLVIDGVEQAAVDPNDLEILAPVPTHGEVIEALQKLPRKEMLEFANSVAQLSEEEGLLNDIAHKYTDNLKDGQVLRLIIFVVFICCVLFGLVTYFWQRRILRRTASVTTGRRRQNLSKREGSSEASERQAAASLLLNAFCLEVADRRLADWPEFPTPIISRDSSSGSVAVQATNEMADAYWKLRTKPKTYWTKENLIDLERATHRWRKLIQSSAIEIETELV